MKVSINFVRKGSINRMEEIKIDPRVLRTRKLISDSFIKLSHIKDFSEITVKDITEEAMINRATFYNHFYDKYDLLERVVDEKLALNLNCSAHNQKMSIEETVKQVFYSLVHFEQSFGPQREGQEDTETINSIIELRLRSIFHEVLLEQEHISDSKLSLKLASILTHTIIGMGSDYILYHYKETPEAFITPLLPFILDGLSNPKNKAKTQL